MRSLPQKLLFTLLLILFALFLIYPILRIARIAFFGLPSDTAASHFTLSYLTAIFQDPALRAGLLNSAIIAVGVTTLCLFISIPLALITTRYDFFGKQFFSALLLVPLILPPFVGAIGMRQILGRFGALTAITQNLGIIPHGHPVDWLGHARILGIILIESLSLYPILFLNLSASLANLDPEMQLAAANLGASRFTIFRRITLPLMRPGLFAGGTIVLIWSFTELGTPLMFDVYNVTPVQVYRLLTQISGNPIPYALIIVMLLVSMLLYIAGRFILGRHRDAAVVKASSASSTIGLSGFKSFLALLPLLIVSTLALIPHLGVVLVSLTKPGSWYQSALPQVFTTIHYQVGLTHPLTLPSVGNSIFFASLSTGVDLIAGMAIAWLVVRSSLPGRKILDTLSMLPLAVPGIVLAFGYLAISLQLQVFFKDQKFWRDLVDVRENPTLLLVVAYAIRRLPYVVRSAVAGLEQTPPDLERAARNLGASGFLTLRRITIPLISANLIAGGLLAFAFAMLEVSDSLILAQKQTHWPITKAIYELYQRLGDGPYIASALGVWAMLLLSLTLLSANSLLSKKMGAIFRV